MKDLKERTLRGGLAKVFSQGASFVLRIGSLAALARLLNPEDFGLVGMVSVVSGIFSLFKDAGLSTVTIQRETISDREVSALFWLNMLVGLTLATLLIAVAPFLAAFYREPRLVPVALVLSSGFLFSSVGVQHQALLSRQMRFTALASVEVIAVLSSVVVGLITAWSGLGYWALVAMAVVVPAVSSVAYWFLVPWVPSRPRREPGVSAMIRFGGTLSLNTLLIYIMFNADKFVIGKLWGAETLGLYGRASQLISLPTENLNSAIGAVAISGLARAQTDPSLFRSYFLKGYSLLCSLTVPVMVSCALFADDIVYVLLGAKWTSAAVIFRLLAPAFTAFSFITPLGWILLATGRARRGLNMAFVLVPSVILGCMAGLPYGPEAVALGLSVSMVLLTPPMVMWARYDTVVTNSDLIQSLKPAVFSSIGAALVGLAAYLWVGNLLSPLPRLVLETAALLASYVLFLLYAFGQKELYIDLLAYLKRAPSTVSAVE